MLPGSPLTSDGFGAACAPLGEELCKAVGTERFVLSAGELLTCQGSGAPGTDETLLTLQVREERLTRDLTLCQGSPLKVTPPEVRTL